MHTSRKPTQIQRLRRTLGFGSAFTSVLKRLLIRLAFFIRPATDQKMCACPSAKAGTHNPRPPRLSTRSATPILLNRTICLFSAVAHPDIGGYGSLLSH